MSNDLVTINYDSIEAETDSAYLFVIEKEDFWFPKSQIEDIYEETKEFVCPFWLANKKGLI